MDETVEVTVKKDGGVWLHNDVVLRLQVDDNPEPLKELRRLVDMDDALLDPLGGGGDRHHLDRGRVLEQLGRQRRDVLGQRR